MSNTPKFWILMALFQIAFGLSVFAITRQFYMPVASNYHEIPETIGQETTDWSDRISEIDTALFGTASSVQTMSQDPAVISRQANESFANGQYSMAADLYQQLLVFGANSVETHNNLGITLHYLGRSSEALVRLNEGIALDPTYQRTWLTLGYVNSQIGNVEDARAALTTAVQMGAGTDVGKSAERMLGELP